VYSYNVSLLLFADNRFNEVVRDNPLLVVLGDWVFAGVQLFSSDPALKLVLYDLYVTPQFNANTAPMYYLIKNRCVVEPSVTLYPMNDTLFALRFQSFKFLTNYTSMYLHAYVQVCGNTESTGRCNRNCPTSTQRRRRDVIDIPPSGRGQMVGSGIRIIISQATEGSSNFPTAILSSMAAPSSSVAMTTKRVKALDDEDDDEEKLPANPQYLPQTNEEKNTGNRLVALNVLVSWSWLLLLSPLVYTQLRSIELLF